jgi:hypothetical protein
VQLLARRRKADQVEVDPAEQRVPVGLGPGRQAVLVVPGGDERVDGVPHPRRVLRLRHVGADRPLERPVVLGVRRDRLVRRRLGAFVDPLFQQRDLFVLERRALLRHLFGAVGPRDRVNEPALGRLAGHDHWSVLAALGDQRGGVEAQVALLLQRAVTARAARGEEGLHLPDVVHLRAGRTRRRAEHH